MPNSFQMKKVFLFALLSLVIMSSAFRSDSTTAEPPASYATIYIYRGGQFFGAGINYAVFANGERICKLSNNRYIEYKTKPGSLALTAHRGGLEVFKKETGLDLDVEAGKKYFIKGDLKSSFTRTRLELSEVTESTAKRDMNGMTVDACQETMDK